MPPALRKVEFLVGAAAAFDFGIEPRADERDLRDVAREVGHDFPGMKSMSVERNRRSKSGPVDAVNVASQAGVA
jgi:hypothetical protein